MSEIRNKQELLDDIQQGFTHFEALFVPFSPDELVEPAMDGGWSVKDNLAHLSYWMQRTINVIQAIKENVELPDPTPGLSETEINEQCYQRNKDRPLSSVHEEFRATYLDLVANVESLSEEELNWPIPWYSNHPVWGLIEGNSYEHYKEHQGYLQPWLDKHYARS